MRTSNTWQAWIYCGLRVGYSKKILPIKRAYALIGEYVDKKGWCVTVTSTQYIYKKGREPGIIVGIIQYPRFQESIESLQYRTLNLAGILLKGLKQNRVSIVFPDTTLMIERE